MSVAVSLPPKWRAWIAENVARSVARSEISAELAASGVADSGDLVAAIAGSIDVAMVAELVESTRRRQTIIDLQRELIGKAPVAHERDLSALDFFRHYFYANRPVVLSGFVTSWPAFGRWTHRWFADNFGDVRVQVCADRTSDPTPDRNAARHVHDTTLGDLIDQIATSGPTNDIYAVSANKLIELPELRDILDDVCPDPLIFPAAQHGPSSTALWIGPHGTVTPLHHDTTNVMLCQMQGEKQITLASPFETQLADAAHDFYSSVDVGAAGWDEEFGEVQLLEVTLQAGDALFIPVGWWHRVVALAPSISLGLMGFAEPNNYSWYRPGSLVR